MTTAAPVGLQPLGQRCFRRGDHGLRQRNLVQMGPGKLTLTGSSTYGSNNTLRTAAMAAPRSAAAPADRQRRKYGQHYQRRLPLEQRRVGLQPFGHLHFRRGDHGRRHRKPGADGPGQADAHGKQHLRYNNAFGRRHWQRLGYWRHIADRQRRQHGQHYQRRVSLDQRHVGLQPFGHLHLRRGNLGRRHGRRRAVGRPGGTAR